MPQTARDVAVNTLLLLERQKGFSTAAVYDTLQKEPLSAADRSLVTKLVYGVIEHGLTLDWVIDQSSTRPVKSAHPAVRAIMRTGAYQILFTDKIPHHAAVSEAVNQIRRFGQSYAAGYVNRVLRSISRVGARQIASLPPTAQGNSLRYSIPLPLIEMWQKGYGEAAAQDIIAGFCREKPFTVQVNTLKTDVAHFVRRMDEWGIGHQLVPGLPRALNITDPAAFLSAEDDAEYIIQDAASQWDCIALDARAGEKIADLCAAPGGKTFAIAANTPEIGGIWAFDRYPEKTAALRKRLQKLGVSRATVACRDSSLPFPREMTGAFDRVLCDVPCSGLGTVRRRPEIRYKPLASFAELPQTQYQILCRGAELVKLGGILQYSTCTLNPAENEQVSDMFLAQHPDFSPRVLPVPLLFRQSHLSPSYRITLFPLIHGTDGFFMASFQKR